MNIEELEKLIQKPKILLVDDIEANITLLEELLYELNVEIHKALSGMEAIQKVKENDYSIILIDVQMPQMDGFETVNRIHKEINRYVPVIFITAVFYEKSYHIKGIKTGAVDFITKPIIPEILIGKVRIFVEQYKNKKELEISHIKLKKSFEKLSKTEKKLSEKHEFLTNVLESITHPFYVIDTKTNEIKLTNKAVKKTIKDLRSFYELTFNEKLYQNYETHLSRHEYVKKYKEGHTIEHSYFDTNNEKKHIEIYNFPVINENNEVVEIIEYFIDITLRKEVEEELEKYQNHLESLIEKRTADLKLAKEKAEKADRLKTAFLKNISHEFRTPMNAIIGFSGLLISEEISKEEKKEYIKHIDQNTNSLLKLIDDIIDIAKIEAGEINLTTDIIDVSVLLKETLKKAQEKMTSAVELKLDIPAKTEIIKTDKKHLLQVINILLSNALKFTEKGTITLGYTLKNNDFIEFFVKDTGIGIPEEQQNIIFERFRKIEADNMKLYRGIGLGLTLAKRVVEILNGEIGVKSKINKGSIFYFSIPLVNRQF